MASLLVTGATGFVGRNLVLRASREGIPVVAPVRNEAKLIRCLAEDGVPSGSVRALPADPAEWGGVAPSLAVLGAGVLFARSREEYFSVNVDWTLGVLRALPPSCRVVILSSQSAGGPTPEGSEARRETDSDHPLTWYGESKLAMERAVQGAFPGRRITILRPPMILGARDSATLPLFRMARGPLRTKPGLGIKHFSFAAVDDVVDAVLAGLSCDQPGPFYICHKREISDLELIGSAARAVGGTGLTLRVPLPLVRLLAAVVDAVPSWREATPSLSRDRAKEIWPDRWVVSPSAFESATGWQARIGLDDALQSACDFYRRSGKL